jgi:hypothetical protein
MAKAAVRRDLSSRPSRPPAAGRPARKKAGTAARRPAISRGLERARRKFLKVFPEGFRDETYLDFERNYKWDAHERWNAQLGEDAFRDLIRAKKFADIAAAAISIESRTNLLFSFEKMALRDAVRSPAGAKAFALALFDFLHGAETMEVRFSNWVAAIGRLPRRKTRVLTWPLVTVFSFIAQPRTHFFLKPTVTREAARRLGKDLRYASRPAWSLYKDLLNFAAAVRSDIRDLRPRDMIDVQSFLWVQGSDEYPD